MADYRAFATSSSARDPCDFRNRMLVCTAPQFEHLDLWTERLRRVGWGSMTAGISSWRHFGQVSFIKRSIDMMNSFVALGHPKGLRCRSRSAACERASSSRGPVPADLAVSAETITFSAYWPN